MKFTLSLNLVISSAVIFIVGAMTFNQIQDTGRIDLFEIGKVLVGCVPAITGALAHYYNPDGTSAKVGYDPLRDKEL